MPYFLVWSLSSSARCIMQYILVLSLVIFMLSLYPLSNLRNFSFTCKLIMSFTLVFIVYPHIINFAHLPSCKCLICTHLLLYCISWSDAARAQSATACWSSCPLASVRVLSAESYLYIYILIVVACGTILHNEDTDAVPLPDIINQACLDCPTEL